LNKLRVSTITTDLAKQTSYSPARYKQYDSAQLLNVAVFENGEAYPLTGYEAIAYMSIPSKTLEQRSCTINNNVLTVKLDSYLLGTAGVVPFEIELKKDDEITTTFRLHYVVEESFLRGG
jgi:hypothetical protein